ncbi:hypothetical protein J5N97_009002 [Dioscorea zingiberensis]|uniref:Uncharacterized protein n=1 Tax=Dioscorea zingiberensis TaxID=325984 RepID=A0A9D5HLX0_9LILI|nr:hypothetical protein J5N97_009002 [Dioscorea zingiberensis]
MDSSGVFVVVICLLAMMVVRSVSQDDGAVPPAMVAFFRGRPDVPLPEAASGGKRSGLVLLVAGVACGVVGAALLGAAAVAFANRGRGSEPGSRSGLGAVLGRRRTGPELRLGA